MPLTKPNQDLKRDLHGIAYDLKRTSVEPMSIAERLSLAGNEADAQAVLKACTVLHADDDGLTGYLEKVKGGLISRLKDA